MGIFQSLFGRKEPVSSPFGIDAAQIFRMHDVKGSGAELCEIALSQSRFLHHGVLPDERHIISFTCDGITRVGLIEVMTAPVGNALIVRGVYDVGPKGTSALIQGLRDCYPE